LPAEVSGDIFVDSGVGGRIDAVEGAGDSERTVGVYFAGASKFLPQEGQVISRPTKSSAIGTGFRHEGQKSFVTLAPP
jgi:hypothetical protein